MRPRLFYICHGHRADDEILYYVNSASGVQSKVISIDMLVNAFFLSFSDVVFEKVVRVM